MKKPTIENLKIVFAYDAKTGFLHRKTGRSGQKGVVKGPAKRISLNGQLLQKTHVIWALAYGYWPTKLIDHINGNQQDNRLVNLREATHEQNQFNKTACGLYPKGVVFKGDASRKKPWAARARLKGKRIYIGQYETMEEAAQAYRDFAEGHQGKFALHNSGIR